MCRSCPMHGLRPSLSSRLSLPPTSAPAPTARGACGSVTIASGASRRARDPGECAASFSGAPTGSASRRGGPSPRRPSSIWRRRSSPSTGTRSPGSAIDASPDTGACPRSSRSWRTPSRSGSPSTGTSSNCSIAKSGDKSKVDRGPFFVLDAAIRCERCSRGRGWNDHENTIRFVRTVGGRRANLRRMWRSVLRESRRNAASSNGTPRAHCYSERRRLQKPSRSTRWARLVHSPKCGWRMPC